MYGTRRTVNQTNSSSHQIALIFNFQYLFRIFPEDLFYEIKFAIEQDDQDSKLCN